ncbi:hypothetical protein [Shinella pollutisoli]|uniref:Uncharacterized protein n=1 Tax=Shinella pollutisoli TaxID=2250594 RepID=A0ABV7DJ04_9HYPH|nr:hypothetical protein [Shinella pollutisoli]
MIRWSAPLYAADRRVASVGRVEIGYVVPPCPICAHWRWYLTFKHGRAAEGDAIDEHGAKTSVVRVWRQWLDDAQLVWAPREERRP